MKLTEVIKSVIADNGALKPLEIAHIINKEKLYIKSDGENITIALINSKINTNPDIFKMEDGLVELIVSYNSESTESAILNEPKIIYISDEDSYDLEGMFKKMVEILWENNFKGTSELHIASLYFFSILPITSPQLVHGLEYLNFDKIYELPKKQRVIAYLKQLEILNKFNRLKNIFSKVLSEKDYIISSEETFNKLFYLINAFEVTLLKDLYLAKWLNNFIEIFSYSNYDRSLYTTPSRVRSIITSLISNLKFDSVYDPAAGYGNLIVDILQLTGPKMVWCEEINNRIFPVLRMNLLVNNSQKTYFSEGDSLKSGLVEKGTIDLIISDLPWGPVAKSIISTNKSLQPNPEGTLEGIFIQDGIHKLKKTGIAFFIVPYGFLFSSKTLKLRQKLITEDLLETVIALPSKYNQPYSNIRTAIIFINKNKNHSRKKNILLIDLKHEFDSLVNLPDKELLKSTFYDWNTVKDYSKVVDSETILNENYELLPVKYLQPKIDIPLRTGENLQVLGKIINNYPGRRFDWYNLRETIPYIKVSNLSENFEDFFLDVSRGELTGVKNRKGTFIDTSVLLVCRVGEKLKPQFFKYENTPLVINSNILAFTVDTEKIDIEYLILELRSRYFSDQLNQIRRLSGIPNFSKNEFFNLFIRLTEKKNDQLIKVREQKEIYLNELEIEHKLKKEKISGKQRQFDLVSTIKHNLSQKLATLTNDLDFVSQSIKKTGQTTISLNEPLNKFTEESLTVILERMNSTVNNAKETLNKTEQYIRVANNENALVKINLIHFIENILIPSYKNYSNFTIFVHYSEDTKKDAFISGTDFYLSELFGNFIQNAIDHGFIDDEKKYEILFHFNIDKQSGTINILISNTGLALPEGFSLDLFKKFGEKVGETSGTGIGGAVIWKILEILGGNIQIPESNSLSMSRYNVKFEIILPMIEL
ncbi:MAG: N-6 DNA methylase [Bacteroidales bacterium]